MKTICKWRHDVPSYPTYEWAETSPQTDAVIVTQKEGYQTEEVISQADMLYISDTDKVSKAVADGTGKEAWAVAEEGGALGAIITVCKSGKSCGGFSSLTPGAVYYLDQSTPGAITSTEPASGEKYVVGVATSATELIFTPYHKA